MGVRRNVGFGCEGKTWSDYDGDSAYGDDTVSGSTVGEVNAYEPGIWRNLLGSASGEYLHNDHLGTMLFTTTASATVSTRRVHTAFGERMGQNRPNDRFGYAGAWGYQRATTSSSTDPYRDGFPFLHVGARYYDPSSGRFLQRDPIGIEGGLNVYGYVGASPAGFADPEGLFSLPDWLLNPIVGIIGPGKVLRATGGQQYVPVLDPGTPQDVVLITSDVVSVLAPPAAIYRTVTATSKTLAALKSSTIGRKIQRIREFVRKDPPHHGRPAEWDGELVRRFRKKLSEMTCD